MCVRVVNVVHGKEVTVIECAIGGLQKCPKFIRSGHTFQGCWLLLILMIGSTQKYGRFIIIIIVIYINGVCYRGSSEMCQIHTHW